MSLESYYARLPRLSSLGTVHVRCTAKNADGKNWELTLCGFRAVTGDPYNAGRALELHSVEPFSVITCGECKAAARAYGLALVPRTEFTLGRLV